LKALEKNIKYVFSVNLVIFRCSNNHKKEKKNYTTKKYKKTKNIVGVEIRPIIEYHRQKSSSRIFGP
jgi:hypothetical protein